MFLLNTRLFTAKYKSFCVFSVRLCVGSGTQSGAGLNIETHVLVELTISNYKYLREKYDYPHSKYHAGKTLYSRIIPSKVERGKTILVSPAPAQRKRT